MSLLMLLRLIGYIMVYSSVGAFLYFFITDGMTTLLIAAGLLIVGALMICSTPGSQTSKQSGLIDWLEIIELPIKLATGVFKFIFTIFN